VKLDVRALGIDGFAEHAGLLAGRDLVLLAEKVETAEEVEAVVALGAALLQGFHFARPEAMPSRPLTGSRLPLVRSAVTLCASADFDDVEQALRTDPACSVRVRNFPTPRPARRRTAVGSIRRALVLVGPRMVRSWPRRCCSATSPGPGGPRRRARSCGPTGRCPPADARPRATRRARGG
jgi:EAL and modified HD-GYP domain-containing signal transduction protein